MADDGWDTYDVLTGHTPAATPAAPASKSGDDGWDTYEAISRPPPSDVSAYEAAGGRATWGDVLQAPVAGYHQALGSLAGAAGELPSYMLPAGDQEKFRAAAVSQQQQAQETEEAMTPYSRSPGFLKHPLVSTAEALPPMAAIAGAGAAGEIVGGPVGGALATGAMFGAQNVGDYANRMRTQGAEPTTEGLAGQFALGAAAGMVPGVGPLSKIATGAITKRVLGIGEGSFTYGAAGVGSEALTQQQEKAAGVREAYDPGAMLTAGEQQAEFGLLGILHGPKTLEGRGTGGETREPGEKAVEQHQDQTGGAFTSTRSGKGDARKDELQGTPGGKAAPVTPRVTEAAEPVVPKATGPLPPTSPAEDPDIAVAATGKVQVPSAEAGTPPGGPKAVVDSAKATIAAQEGAPAAVSEVTTPKVTAPKVTPGVTRPAPSDELMQQQTEMLDKKHPRDVVHFPADVEAPALSKQQRLRYGSVKLDDGSILQYDRSAGSKVDSGKLKGHREAGTLDQYVDQVRKASEDRVAAKTAPPPPPETPETPITAPPAARSEVPGTPLPEKGEAPSAASLEAPGGIRPEVAEAAAPQPPALDRSKGLAALLNDLRATGRAPRPDEAAWLDELGISAPKARPTAEALTGEKVTLGVAEEAGKPRVLEAAPVTEHERALTKQEELKAKKRAKDESKAVAKAEKTAVEKADEVGGKHRTKAEIAKIEENNRKAKEIVDRHPPVEGETLDDRRSRAERMVKEAKAEGVKIPDEFGQGTLHSPDVMLLNEAKELTKNKLSTVGQHSRFFDQEHLLRARRMEEAVDVRRAEGAKGMGSPEGATEVAREEATHEASPEEELIRKQEEEKEPHDDWAVSAEAPREDILKKIEAAKAIARDTGIGEAERANALRGVERLQTVLHERGRERPTITEAKEGEHYTVPTEKKAPVVVAMKRRGAKTDFVKDAVEETKKPEAERQGDVVETLNKNWRTTKVHTLLTSNVRDVVGHYFKPEKYAPEMRPMMQRLFDKVMEIAGDVKVHFVTMKDMKRIVGNAHGAYNPNDHYIFLNAEDFKHDTPFHEAVHAATKIALDYNPDLKALIDDLRAEALEQTGHTPKGRGIWDLYKNADEFLTYTMTRPEAQEFLKGVKISPELAEKIGIPKWRKATLWEGVLSTIRRALGMGPRDVSAIEAAIALTEKTFYTHPSQAGELMEYTGRFSRAQIEEHYMNRQIHLLDKKEATSPQRFLADRAEREESERQAGPSYARSMAQATHNALRSGSITVLGHAPKIQDGPSMELSYGKWFTDDKGNIIKDYRTLSGRINEELHRMRDKDQGLIERALINAKKYSESMPDYARLKELTNGTQIDATKPYVKPKGKGGEHMRGLDIWRTNANWSKANELYEKLPEELQKQFTDEIAFGKEKARLISGGFVDAVLNHFPLPAGVTDDTAGRAALKDRILKGDMTDDEREHYYNLKAVGELDEAKRLTKGKKVFFPAFRSGDLAVYGRHSMPDGGFDTDFSGKTLPDNVREFDDREEAHKYFIGGADRGLHPKAEFVKYARDTGEKLTTALDREAADARAQNNIETRYQVNLQREHMELHDKIAEAEQARKDMDAAGIKELSGVVNRRDSGNWGRINKEFANKVKQNIGHSDLNDEGKEAAAEAVRNFMLIRQSAIQSHLVYRRYVGGADYTDVGGLHDYSEAANRHIVSSKYAAERDDIARRMEAQAKINEKDPAISMQSSAAAKEMLKRMYGAPEDMASKTPWLVRNLQTYAYAHYMAGIRHMLMQLTHPVVYSLPQIAGRHGRAATLKEMDKAFSDIGGKMQGISGGLGAIKRFAKAALTGDPEARAALLKAPNTIQGMLSLLRGNKDEYEDFQKLNDIGLFRSGSQDFATLSGKNKLENFLQQFNEGFGANRVGVALTAYRRELALTGSREKAMDYAREMVERTIGSTNPMDVGSAMKYWPVRTFMQFKHFPMRQVGLLLRNVYNAFRDEDPQIRREAWQAAANQIISSFSMAGIHGLPVDIAKPLVILGYAMGVGPSPSQIDDKFRRMIAGVLGPTGAGIFMDGILSAFPHAPNAANMFSRAADFAYGEPRQYKGGVDVMSWIAETAFGAPASVAIDTLKGLRAGYNLEWSKALTYLPLPRQISDIARAWNIPSQGLVTLGGKQLTAPSYVDTFWRMTGFQTQEASHAYSARQAAQEKIQEQKDAGPQTPSERLKAIARAKREKDILGIPVSKKNKKILQETQELYQ